MNRKELEDKFYSQIPQNELKQLHDGITAMYTEAYNDNFPKYSKEALTYVLPHIRNGLIFDEVSNICNKSKNLHAESKNNGKGYDYLLIKSTSFILTLTRYNNELAKNKSAKFRDDLNQMNLWASLINQEPNLYIGDLQYGNRYVLADSPDFININFFNYQLKINLCKLFCGKDSEEFNEAENMVYGKAEPILSPNKKENAG